MNRTNPVEQLADDTAELSLAPRNDDAHARNAAANDVRTNLSPRSPVAPVDGARTRQTPVAPAASRSSQPWYTPSQRIHPRLYRIERVDVSANTTEAQRQMRVEVRQHQRDHCESSTVALMHECRAQFHERRVTHGHDMVELAAKRGLLGRLKIMRKEFDAEGNEIEKTKPGKWGLGAGSNGGKGSGYYPGMCSKHF